MIKQLLTVILTLGACNLMAQKQITLEDIYKNRTFTQERLGSLNWMNNGQFYTALEDNQVVRYDVTTGDIDSVIVDGKILNIEIDEYEFSNDEKKILLLTDRESIYRRSFTAEYYVYTFEGEEFKKLSDKGRQSYATFSPDNSMVAFVRENDLFYVKLVNMSEYAITDDGEFGKIINGGADWVYEEELRLTKAFNWSPDGKRIAFYRFDESEVREYNLQYWDEGALYPRDYRYKYPKAGEKNAVVSIHIHRLDNNQTTKVDLGKDTDFYVPRILWTKNPNTLSVLKLNRLQNRLDILHADANSGRTTMIFSDKSRKYIDINYTSDLIYLNNKTQFLFSSERSGYNHYYLHKIDGQVIGQATAGNWSVEKFVGLDQSKKTPMLYYVSTEESSMERHFYKVYVNGKGKVKLSTQAGMNAVDMSKDFKYYISTVHSAESPQQITLVSNKSNKPVKVIKDNAALKQTTEEYGISPKQFFQIEGHDKRLLNAYMIQPSGLDSAGQYPVLIFQYSGPGSQNVRNSWAGSNFYWHQMLSQKGYIVVVVDTRGTGGRGEEFKKMTYKQLGKLESEDLAASARYLGAIDFIDQNRIGLWGWSYGGYMSSLTLMKYPGLFKAGIAVAPVTTWRYYDTIYTERYLQRPQDNPDGYDANSPNTHAPKLRDKFLLIHGTGDDNVHFQNSVALQNELIKNGRQFESFYYPDKAHGIRKGEATRLHLYNLMTNFILSNL